MPKFYRARTRRHTSEGTRWPRPSQPRASRRRAHCARSTSAAGYEALPSTPAGRAPPRPPGSARSRIRPRRRRPSFRPPTPSPRTAWRATSPSSRPRTATNPSVTPSATAWPTTGSSASASAGRCKIQSTPRGSRRPSTRRRTCKPRSPRRHGGGRRATRCRRSWATTASRGSSRR